jgi:tetratricopeptide (TPR) repeat protein
MQVRLAVLVFTVLLSGCVTAPRTSPSAALANAASTAQKRGDWAVAAQLWEQAIEKETTGLWRPEFAASPRLRAIYHYELGRSLGVLEKYDEGEKNLLQALRLDEQSNGPKGMDLVELARLNHARGNNDRAASFINQFLPRLDEASEADPAAYIALLNEVIAVFQALDQNSQASELKAKAEKFSARHPNAKIADNYGWTPYKVTAK